MKKFFIFSLAAMIAVPVLADTTKTSTTSTYEESSSAPVMNTDTGTGVSSDSEMIEAEEYDQPMTTDEVDDARIEDQTLSTEEQQRMDERSDVIESEDAIDYSDRTRTNRERKALNTGSHASDDE